MRLRDGRTFQAMVRPNLFGDQTVMLAWGSIYGRAGGGKVETYDDMEQAISRLHAVSRRRALHGYALVMPSKIRSDL